MGDRLAGYERGAVVAMPLEQTTAIPFRQERDRCYAVVLRLQPGSTLSKRVRREGVMIGGGSIDEGEHVRLHDEGGSAWFCPLEAAKQPLLVYFVMPTDRRLGTGELVVEVWSKRMSAAWVREERENRRIAQRYLESQEPTTPNPRCKVCDQQFQRCREAGKTADDDWRCMTNMRRCQSDNRCW